MLARRRARCSSSGPGRTLTLGPGALIGEIEVLNPGPGRMATITAEDDTTCIVVTRAELLEGLARGSAGGGGAARDPRRAVSGDCLKTGGRLKPSPPRDQPGDRLQPVAGWHSSRDRAAAEPRRPVPALVPQHREERLVQREVALALVARVDEVDVRLVEAHLDRQHVRDERHPRHRGVRVRRRAVPREAVVERAAARLDDDRHEVELGALRSGVRGPARASPPARGTASAPGGDFGHRCEPRTYSIGPASAVVSWSEIQQVSISAGTR